MITIDYHPKTQKWHWQACGQTSEPYPHMAHAIQGVVVAYRTGQIDEDQIKGLAQIADQELDAVLAELSQLDTAMGGLLQQMQPAGLTALNELSAVVTV